MLVFGLDLIVDDPEAGVCTMATVMATLVATLAAMLSMH